MTPAFAEGLVGFEKQPMALRLYFPDLVAAVDLGREEKRLESAEFASQATAKQAKQVAPPKEPELTGAERNLQEAEQLYRNHDLGKAKQAFLRVTQETSQSPLHARAYYGLARIAALEKDPELAEKLFQKSLELSPDDETKAWTYLYLGRLADASARRDEAMSNYRSVLSIEGAPPSARTAAEQGLQQSFAPKN